MSLLVGVLVVYLAAGCWAAIYSVWRLYSPAQAVQLQQVLDDADMDERERERLFWLLSQPKVFLKLYLALLLGWPWFAWKAWGPGGMAERRLKKERASRQ